ncbi:hypothetical protein Hanom_Chr07g00598281 [Helianthus anomalus]
MSEEGECGLVDPLIRGGSPSTPPYPQLPHSYDTTNNNHSCSYPPITHLVPDLPAPLPSLIDFRNSLLALVDYGSHLFYQIPSLSLLIFLLHPTPYLTNSWIRVTLDGCNRNSHVFQ